MRIMQRGHKIVLAGVLTALASALVFLGMTARRGPVERAGFGFILWAELVLFAAVAATGGRREREVAIGLEPGGSTILALYVAGTIGLSLVFMSLVQQMPWLLLALQLMLLLLCATLLIPRVKVERQPQALAPRGDARPLYRSLQQRLRALCANKALSAQRRPLMEMQEVLRGLGRAPSAVDAEIAALVERLERELGQGHGSAQDIVAGAREALLLLLERRAQGPARPGGAKAARQQPEEAAEAAAGVPEAEPV
ncbi:MAG: hypothetical protein GXX99_01620 [Clostridiales bacterium]|nr:hypothetical protein [Clostridiales bacterium]